MTEREQERAIIAEAIVNAWRDEGYREKLIQDGAAVLREAGLALPPGCRVTVVQNAGGIWHAAVPRMEDLAGGDPGQIGAEIAALLPLPAGVELHLHQDTGDERFVVLPQPPGEVDALSDEELMLVVGGGNGGTGGDGGASTLFGPGSGTVIVLGGNGGNGGVGGNGGEAGLI